MKRLSAWWANLSDRTVNILFITLAVICISVFLSGMASFITTRSQQPPYEYVFQPGDGATEISPGLVELKEQSVCYPNGTVQLPSYISRVNRAPIRVTFASTWWDRKMFRGKTLATSDDLFYTNYPFVGEVLVPGRDIPLPEDIEPGEYFRVVSASTPITWPEMYLLPVTVKTCTASLQQ